MAGTMRKIARVGLVRVFAVLALAVGIALLQGTPCEGDLVPSEECSISSVQVLADPDDLDGLGAVPEICLAVLFAVLLLVIGLRLPHVFPVRGAAVPVRRGGPCRRPEVRLTQLCVSRT
ncbi:hypothetical protein [Lentzea sp. NBRC 102530]|uniref:hypothetical protein n=1 Tax=Lentzea sp. NBRC 102530 TaxID=3032201 RepID=UPI00249FCD11|nr:hypothetical protein [Lentzea sp. NBRC 102530]GLY50639.1 hypothetical protein Lesp01_42950 [Lentzea sp. NBRC 102530]